MVDQYGPTLAIDVLVVFTCVFLLVRFGNLRFAHPATPYIVFHVHTVTVRLAGLLNGAPHLYENTVFFTQVVPSEIVRAAQYGDYAFGAVTLVWILFEVVSKRRPQPQGQLAELPHLMLDPRLLRPILLLTFAIGIVGLRVGATIPGLEAFDGFDPDSAWSSSSYLAILPSWSGLAVLGYAYYYGFGKISAALLAVYLGLMALQGGLRFRAIIGLLLGVQILVERANRRWPTRATVLGLAAVALLFFPMKEIGTKVQGGEGLTQVAATVSDSVINVTEGSSADQLFLDEFASALTLLDARGELYMGSIYLPLLTLPIPRAIWPNKPVLAGFITDISTRSRPMSRSGMITTYLGEAYANFGVYGIFLVPPVVAFALAAFYRRASRAPYNSVLRFAYTVLSVNLLQVYRDGLQSVVVFTFVNMMPLTIIVLAHVIRAAFQGKRQTALQQRSS